MHATNAEFGLSRAVQVEAKTRHTSAILVYELSALAARTRVTGHGWTRSQAVCTRHHANLVGLCTVPVVQCGCATLCVQTCVESILYSVETDQHLRIVQAGEHVQQRQVQELMTG